LTGLKAGSYSVRPFGSGLFNQPDGSLYSRQRLDPEKTVHVKEGDHVTDIDFSLTPGGIITGRIVDPDGWSITDMQVKIVQQGDKQPLFLPYSASMYTDDRGMYRLYGVPAGRFLVSVGDVESDGVQRRSNPFSTPIPVTYYPSVQDPSLATPVEVAEGRETSGIDFKAPRFLHGFRVSGIAQEEVSGLRVGDLSVMIRQVNEAGFPTGSLFPARTGVNGEFEQGDLPSGNYEIVLGPMQETHYSANPVPFEIVDQDVKGVILLLRPGDASISGQVILEGVDPGEAAAKLRGLQLRAFVMEGRTQSWRKGSLAPDGSFSLQGLPPGRLGFGLGSDEFVPSRYELNGSPGNYLMEGIPLEPGDRLTGLKLYFVEKNCILLGVVRTNAGPLPKGFSGWVQPRLEKGRTFILGTEVDERGMFRFEKIPPGDLELTVYVSGPSPKGGTVREYYGETRQRVSLRPGQETQVEILIQLTPQKRGEPDGTVQP
jgi:hypothetical protein